MLPSKAAFELCPTRQVLLRTLTSAVERIIDLGCLEIAAVTNGKSAHELDCIARELAQAIDAKTSLLETYMSHVAGHGCG